jgi:hypothetical protein
MLDVAVRHESGKEVTVQEDNQTDARGGLAPMENEGDERNERKKRMRGQAKRLRTLQSGENAIPQP